MTRTSSVDYEQLCSLDMLGLEDRADRNQQCVHEEFREQLRQNTEGWYEMGWLQKHMGTNPYQTKGKEVLEDLKTWARNFKESWIS